MYISVPRRFSLTWLCLSKSNRFSSCPKLKHLYHNCNARQSSTDSRHIYSSASSFLSFTALVHSWRTREPSLYCGHFADRICLCGTDATCQNWRRHRTVTSTPGQAHPLAALKPCWTTYFPITASSFIHRRSHWPRGLRCGSEAARLLRLWVRIPPGVWMFVVSVVCREVEVGATSWSLVQRSPSECDASLCVI